MNNQITTNPTCPHCGYGFDEEETWNQGNGKTGTVYTGDCDPSELHCPNGDCKKAFYTLYHHIIKFSNHKEKQE